MTKRLSWLCLAALVAWAGPGLAQHDKKLEIKALESKGENAVSPIDFSVDGKLVARYVVGPTVAKPYLWPLMSPAGVPITRAWPMESGAEGGTRDHVHQKSAWFCYGDVIPEGMEIKDKAKGIAGVDFWTEGKGRGRIVCTKMGPLQKQDANHAFVATHNEWQTADGVKILDEDRVVHLYPMGDSYLFVFDIDLAATVVPITFADTKEGAFGIRINDAIREQLPGKGKLTNAEGKISEKNIWGFKSDWCDYSGELNGKVVGLAIFDDPANPARSCWHSRAYGLMAANPFGRAASGFPGVRDQKDLVKLQKGEHLKLRYGLFVHSGDAKEGKVAEQFDRFVKMKQGSPD
jgi:Methane oxygenase PmoA